MFAQAYKLMDTTVYIKNMVCQRCVTVVTQQLQLAGFAPVAVGLGFATLKGDSINDKLLSEVLQKNGFELLEEKSARLINEVKLYIISLVRNGGLEDEKFKISTLIEQKFGREYGYISHLFSQAENTTLEKYLIAQKVEMAKELLTYNELTLTQIAYQLGYSSVAHLSAQFKQVTGFTPSGFKQLKDHHRKPIDKL